MKCKKNDCFSCPYPDCINDYVKPRYELSPEQKERERIRAAERYRARRGSGVCVICGNRPAVQGKTKCVECNISFNRYKRDWTHASGTLPRSLMDGVAICKHCGKRQPLEGHKVCENCYSALLAALNEANRKRRRGKMAELKPCPFCGGEATIVPHEFYSAVTNSFKVESYGVLCKKCGTSGYQFFGCEKHAVEAWNRRVNDG